jgi:peptidoglycan/xylan/chitin deacetylase (PgdA/CDA1 family)
MRFFDNQIPRYYYYVKPFIPRRLQLLARRVFAARKRWSCGNIWPIDQRAGRAPKGWRGWPDNKQFAFVLTHDVDTWRGHERCRRLMELEMEQGVRSSFNFVAADYPVSEELRRCLADHGFEVGLHGLRHNRSLYESPEEFARQAVLINRCLAEWGAEGFRSPSMYHNLAWLHGLDIAYDASTFDTDPFEPQPDGVGTIFPFFVAREGGRGYVELPYTLPQDFTLFVLFGERNIDTWKRKLDWVAECGGMVLVNTHPDYMQFAERKAGYEEYPARLYRELLTHVRRQYAGSYWHALPREMAKFWRALGLRPGECAEDAAESPYRGIRSGYDRWVVYEN